MLIELRDHILASVAVGGGMWPDTLPQNPTLPAISYQVISASRRPTMRSRDTLPRIRVQMDCWGASSIQAKAVADDVLEAIDCFIGLMGSPAVVFNAIFAENEFSQYDEVAKMYRFSRDYMVWARE